MTHAHAFVALCIVWAVSQLWIGRRRSGDATKRRDRGTLDILIVVIFASLALATWLAVRDDGQLAAHHPRLAWTGMGVMLAGLVLRWWSVRTLAQFFTVDIAIQPGQTLVRRGPYRLLRHPSYTGALLTVVGFGIGTGAWPAALVAIVPITLAFLHRIRIEERMLADAFPEAWPGYARETRRLIPFLW
jgi:protein-S-isoprenylcysteine O-methyltransferase